MIMMKNSRRNNVRTGLWDTEKVVYVLILTPRTALNIVMTWTHPNTLTSPELESGYTSVNLKDYILLAARLLVGSCFVQTAYEFECHRAHHYPYILQFHLFTLP